jgi:hypothetical protein
MWDKIAQLREVHERKIVTIVLAIAIILETGLLDILPSSLNNSLAISIIVFCVWVLADDIIDIKRIIKEPSVQIFSEYLANNDSINRYVAHKKVKNVFMIEYSSWSIQGVITSLIRSSTAPNIYLLIQDPNEGRCILGQKERIWNQIARVIYQQDEIKDYPNIKILCYRQRASLKGRNLDNKLINIGWYTYKYNSDGEQLIYGHDMPTISIDTSSPNFGEILKLFNSSFINMWDNGITLREVCAEFESEIDLCHDDKFLSWCDKVSPSKEGRKIEITQ